jgi:multidrug efflux pump subunit AcrA (membrane-fusion protein)
MAMIALRVVLASFVSTLALAPALASDNSKSHLDPDIHVYGRADQMSTSDQTPDQTSDNSQVATVFGPPNPNDPNYVQELQTQLQQQQQALTQAQAALAQAQAQLAVLQAMLSNAQTYSNNIYNSITAAQKAYNTTRTNYANGEAPLSALSAATEAFRATVALYGLSLRDNNANPDGTTSDVPEYVVSVPVNMPLSQYVGFAVYDGLAVNYGDLVKGQISQFQTLVQDDQIEVTRLQASVAATQAQITAAQNGQSPPGQTSDTNNQTANNTDTTDLSDPSIMANAAIDGGGQADSGGADGGD